MRTIISLLFLLSISFTAAALPKFYYPETVCPGDPLRIIIDDDSPINKLESKVKNSSGRTVSDGEAFPFAIAEDKIVWITLLGIPSTLPGGDYTLIFEGTNERFDFYIEKQLIVEEKQFISEDIPLNKSMSDLRTTDDPRKAEESKELLAVVNTFNREEVYLNDTFIEPLPGAAVSSHFGDRRTYLYADGGMGNAIHFGIDLVKPRGTPVKACGDGNVVLAKPRIISGKTVILEHGPGVYSLYYHLDSIALEQGNVVKAGETVGTVGATGLVTGAHLHWEIRCAGVPVSPAYLLEHKLLDKETILSIISQD